jgi:penicillin-binding protein 1A
MGGRGRQGQDKKRVEPRLFAGRNRTEPSRRRPARKRRSFLRGLIKFSFLLAFLGTIGLSAVFGYVWISLDQKGLLKIPDRDPGIMILAADGTALAEQGSFFGDEVRLPELPDYVANAVIAIEDRRFRSHFGIDPIGLFRAASTNARAGRLVQGGSTITQQLAKNLFLTPERTLQRKLQEAVLAIWLESQFSKDEILQLYLNRVYFGAGATGIEKAAAAYYRKSARELTLGEAATLAGLLRAPATYSPINHPEAAADRAKLVIAAMAEMGVITKKEAESALSASGEIAASNYVPSTRYVVDWLNEQLPDLIKHYSQSIIIETTIDAKLQSFAERALRKRLNEEGKKLAASEGALVILDTTGAVKAMVGGKSYRRSQFNRVTKAKRQPGSAFKPFVYLAAIEAGLTPDTIEVDEPVRLGSWVPENYKQQYMGPVTLRKALALSLNTVAVKLSTYVGPPAVIEAAHRLGILSPLGKDASIALGTSEVTLLELTDAMVPFANGGTPVVPFAITRIRSRDGVLLYERAGDGFQPVVTVQAVAAMNDMLRAVVTEGTARRAQFGSFDIAGKTGTSQNYRDAWFIGYTPYYVGGVWVGNDDNAPTRKVTGGSIPTAIWKDVMEVAHEGLDPAPLPFSTGSEVDYFAYDDEFNAGPGDGKGGLLSALESLFGAEKSGEPKKKKRPTAFERAEKARESR